MKYPNLFQPITIGNMTVKNRIFQSPVGSHLAGEDFQVTDEMLAYYDARLRGGMGLMTTEYVLVTENTNYGTYHNLGLHEDRTIAEMKKLTDLAHKYDVKLCVQLMHPSSYASAKYNKGIQSVAASPLETRALGEISRSATIPELEAIVKRFGDAAERAVKAGFDAIEIHCCHGHGLLGRFLSPMENKRVDRYGGNLEGRLRLTLEVLHEIRSRVPENYPIMMRMSSEDGFEGGQSLMDGRYIAKRFEEEGASMIHMSYGTFTTPWETLAPAGTPKAFNMDRAASIKEAISIPLGFIGRMNEPWVAEMVLALGKADACYMGRSMLCDPEFPNKALEGREDEIRPCIGCNHCISNVNFDHPVRCTMNPEAGREYELRDLFGSYGTCKGKVLVLGGGPAGLTAAKYAAKKGFDVELVEASDRLGGQMYLAAFPPCKQEIAAGTRYMIEECERNGVTIRTGCKLTAEEIKAGGYDHIIVCTGGEPIVPGFLKGAGHLASSSDVLEGKTLAGVNTVVVGGGLVGCETADFLAHPFNDMNVRSRRVTIIEMLPAVASDLKTSERPLLIRRLLGKNVNILTSSKVISVDKDVIKYEKDGEIHELRNVDTVVSAVGVKSVNGICDELRNIGVEPIVIGDALKAPGTIHGATEAAIDVAAKL